MRIEIKDRGPKEFYDEFMYVAANFRKFRSNPEAKARLQTVVYSRYAVLAFAVILVMVCMYFLHHEGIFLLLSGMMLICFILLAVLVASMKKRINLMMSEKGVKTVEIDEKGVKYESEAQTLKIRWDDITAVIINRHSIIFMPRTEIQFMISVYTAFREEILSGIRDAGHMDLVVDNTNKNGHKL